MLHIHYTRLCNIHVILVIVYRIITWEHCYVVGM